MALRETDPKSYITEYTLAYEYYPGECAWWREVALEAEGVSRSPPAPPETSLPAWVRDASSPLMKGSYSTVRKA